MSITVKAKCFNGSTYELACDPSELVQSFQEKIAGASGIQPDRQRILYKGQVLEEDKPLSNFSIADGVTVNVVRKVGKSGASVAAAPKAAAAPATESAPAATTEGAAAETAPFGGMPGMPGGMPGMPGGMPGMGGMPGGANGYEELLRQFQAMGGAAGAEGGGLGGLGGMGGMPPGMGGMPPGMGGGNPAQMQQLMSQMPDLISSLWTSQEVQDYLNNPSKMEELRKSLESNPFLKGMTAADPNMASVVGDPDKWQSYMQQTRDYFATQQPAAGADGGIPSTGGTTGPTPPSVAGTAAAGIQAAAGGQMPGGMSYGIPPAAMQKAEDARKRTEDMASIEGIDTVKLSEAYGHALGQSLINSALGLDPDLVIKGLGNACEGESFPMPLQEFERQMRTLQSHAAQFLSDFNLEDANRFFQETEKDEKIHVLSRGRIVWESAEPPPDPDAPQATENSEVLVILEGRLLDGRTFFTCPAADRTGETVHPLSLPLSIAPSALAEGIVGMRKGESRTLYVHPTAAAGMTDMFGELLPPNAMLAFDIELVSCNAEEEDGPM